MTATRSILAAAVLLAATAAAQACPMCRDGVATASTTAPASAAAAVPLDFNTSVYVMLAVVAVVATAAGRAMVKAVRG